MANIKNLIFAVLLGFALYSYIQDSSGPENFNNAPGAGTQEALTDAVSAPFGTSSVSNTGDVIADAYEQRQSDIQVTGSGVVVHLLPDDTQGSRHQKFILKLASGRTLLISHNIDLAPRINTLQKGDTVQFYGEYEWNDRGGVVHWTHRDPQGRHENGWLKHKGSSYQ